MPSDDELIAHCRAVAEVIPVVGFYLQPAVGGRVLPYAFWRRFAEIPNVVAIKIAPFNRYQTIDVVRAVAEAGRDDIALYTGNDDNIVVDLLTPFDFKVGRHPDRARNRRRAAGPLGRLDAQRRSNCSNECRAATKAYAIPADMLRRNVQVTDANAAFFDAANAFAGCIAGLHEVLRRQGLLEGIWCSTSTRRSAPASARRSTASTAPTRI